MELKTPFDTDLLFILQIKRKKLSLTQAQVAKKLGLSSVGLSYLERGIRELKLTTLEKWAKILDLEIMVEVKEK